MPDIAPLVTCRADNQSLFALNADDGAGNLQNFSKPPVTLTGTSTVNTVAGTNVAQIAVPYDFTGNPSLPFYNIFGSLNYTANLTSGTLDWVLIVNGNIVQTITQTPSGTAQTVAFNPYIAVSGTPLTASGTTNAQISVAWNGPSGTIVLTTTTIKPLTCVVQGCKSI
jgi:hypothetical protein